MNIDWDKVNGLLPVIIQHAETSQVLMLGYMNAEALQKTTDEKIVTFFSRTKNRLWTKGETSGNTLILVSMHLDCDNDTLLCKALPMGPTCHTGDETCFHDDTPNAVGFLNTLTNIIQTRNATRPTASYTTTLFEQGKSRIAQKVGEEGVELALACMKEDRAEITNECADLIFHAMVLLEQANLSMTDVCNVLKDRHKK